GGRQGRLEGRQGLAGRQKVDVSTVRPKGKGHWAVARRKNRSIQAGDSFAARSVAATPRPDNRRNPSSASISMPGSTFGELFRVTNFGESHGPAIGCVIDGCPPGMALSEADIQPDLDRRRPGTSRHVTQRNEPDAVEILSGVYEGKTTGTPICLLIR